jgi:hypothetical protein
MSDMIGRRKEGIAVSKRGEGSWPSLERQMRGSGTLGGNIQRGSGNKGPDRIRSRFFFVRLFFLSESLGPVGYFPAKKREINSNKSQAPRPSVCGGRTRAPTSSRLHSCPGRGPSHW